jgi:hypothetical protein
MLLCLSIHLHRWKFPCPFIVRLWNAHCFSIGLCAVQALQGEVCLVWLERRPLPEHLWRPHHPLPRPSHQGQRHHQDRSGDQQDHGLHQVIYFVRLNVSTNSWWASLNLEYTYVWVIWQCLFMRYWMLFIYIILIIVLLNICVCIFLF